MQKGFTGKMPVPRVITMYIESLEPRYLLSVTWGWQGQQIRQDLAASHFPTIDGRNESIAIIDTGVDYTHPLLGGTFGTRRSKVSAGYNFQDGNGDPYPADGVLHGTASAGMAASLGYTLDGNYYQGIAPAAHVIAIRATYHQGVEALNWVIAHRTQYNIVAVNILDPEPHLGNQFAALYNTGVFVAEGAGNAGPTKPPLSYTDVFSIGSSDEGNTISSFSTRGPKLALVAPGNNVMVVYDQGGAHVEIPGQGTSWAAPQVAGAAALLKQINSAFTPAQIMAILKRTGTPIYDSISGLTYEQLNLNGALTLATELTHPSMIDTVPQPTFSDMPIDHRDLF